MILLIHQAIALIFILNLALNMDLFLKLKSSPTIITLTVFNLRYFQGTGTILQMWFPKRTFILQKPSHLTLLLRGLIFRRNIFQSSRVNMWGGIHHLAQVFEGVPMTLARVAICMILVTRLAMVSPRFLRQLTKILRLMIFR